MGIAIRKSPLKGDKSRLSLDIYHGGKSVYENLSIFVYDRPKTNLEREHNRKTNALAENIKAKRIIEIQDNQHSFSSRSKADINFLNYFKELKESKIKDHNNYLVWCSAYKHLINFVKDKNLAFKDIDEVFVKSFKGYLQNGKLIRGKINIQDGSASTYFGKLKAVLNQAYNDGIIDFNPGKKVKNIKVQEKRRNFLLIEELKRLTHEECEIPLMKQAFLFSCLTGLRWSDIENLRWGDVIYSESEDQYKINFTQKKTKGVEHHPISKEAMKIIGTPRDNDQNIFKDLTYSGWKNEALTNWVKAAGIDKKITFHCARHTYATLLLTAGGDIYTVSSLLGHKDLKTTQIYAKIINSKKNSVVDLMPSIGIEN